MWIVGSILSQVVILTIAPHDYLRWWYGYIFMTMAYSALGVFTFGVGSLFGVHYFQARFRYLITWRYGIPCGAIAGWFATVLLIVIAQTVIGDANQFVRDSPRWIIAALFGSLYGITGACYLLIDNKKNNAEQISAANPHAFGTSGISAAEHPRMPEASGDT